MENLSFHANYNFNSVRSWNVKITVLNVKISFILKIKMVAAAILNSLSSHTFIDIREFQICSVHNFQIFTISVSDNTYNALYNVSNTLIGVC